MTIIHKVPAHPTKQDMDKPWFVRFSFEYNGKVHVIKQQRKINYETNFSKRVKLHNDLVKAVEKDLEAGWNPVTKEFPQSNKTLLNNALDFALKKGSWSTTTLKNYTNTIKFVKTAAIDIGLSNKPIVDVERIDIKRILERVKEARSWSNKSYNKNLGYLGAVFAILMEWEPIKYNPAHGIKTLPVTETQFYIPLTNEEKKRIKDEIAPKHERFYAFLMVIFQTGIRPKEVLALKVGDIDLPGRVINIIPDLQEENSKTKLIRRVPVSTPLLKVLESLMLSQYPAEYFVFGSPFKSGGGNRGSQKGRSGAMRSDYFIPSTTQIKRDTLTKFWNTLVIDGLGIQKQMYALKHTGANEKLLAGIPIDALRELYGHTSKMMTEKYLSVLKEINRKEIIDKSPDF